MSMACGSSCNNIHNAGDGLLVIHILLPNLVPQLGLSVAWLDYIPVYCLCPMFSRHCHYPHKRYGMPSPVVSGNNVHYDENGLVLLQFSQNMVQQLGCSVDWLDGITLY